MLPNVYDDHLFSIETQLRIKIKERNLCMKTLMGEKEEEVEPVHVAQQHLDPDSPSAARRGTFTFTCEKKCLKCMKLC